MMRTPAAGLVFASALALCGCGDSGSTSSDGSGGGDGAGGATATSGSTSTASSPTSTDASTGSGADPYAAEREICINKINELRATKGLPPYTRWTDAESCVDEQATSDEMTNSPHGAWVSGTYPCNGGGQNECLGAGPSGIEGCLQQMWDEKDQAGCSGCDACADAYDPSCPNCDFYGSGGQVCGHYVNMSAKYFTAAACGFSSLGGWDAINFK